MSEIKTEISINTNSTGIEYYYQGEWIGRVNYKRTDKGIKLEKYHEDPYADMGFYDYLIYLSLDEAKELKRFLNRVDLGDWYV